VSAGACILGCSGPRLTRDERAFFAEARPWGFILFGRNVEDPAQVRALVGDLRAAVGRHAPVLIDQEGGRVQRLRPPHWRRYPPGRAYGRLPRHERREVARLGARLIAHDLAALGIDVDCLPVLDTPAPEGHAVIGDRAYAEAPDEVAVLGRAACEGLIAGGVLPVIKHIPGHGRAPADSHEALPVVTADRPALASRDFVPFKALSDMPLAMSAHVVYAAVDPERPATLSTAVVGEVIRGEIGFGWLLITDDISMRALSGDVRARAEAARAAGCDVVLHCNGAMREMQAVAAAAGALAGEGARRADAALARLATTPEPFDAAAARARFDAAFGGRWAA
jgi:beta-N-acetylhexosaminidase